jgi:hypothetical protein
MHPLRRIAALLGVAALLLAGSLASTHSAFAASQSGVVGHVYVNLNSSPNVVAAFDRHTDGSLTATPGSPFSTGGSGLALPSQGALQQSSDGKYLLAVNAGSNQISVLSIKNDGSLKLASVTTEPFGATAPTTIAVWGNEVVVGNDGDSSTGGAKYVAFTLNSGGKLTPTGWSYSLPTGTVVADVFFSPNGQHLIGNRENTSLIDSFTPGPNGTFTPAAGSPFTNPAGYYGPFGSQFNPASPDQLYISNAHTVAGGGVTPGTVSAFNVAGDGTFSEIGAAPYATDGQTATCWVAITHSGQYLYGVNTGSSSVSAFTINSDGSLSLIGSTTIGGAGALDIGVAPGDGYAYVVERGSNQVVGLSINGDGSVSLLPSSPTQLPASGAAFGIVVD